MQAVSFPSQYQVTGQPPERTGLTNVSRLTERDRSGNVRGGRGTGPEQVNPVRQPGKVRFASFELDLAAGQLSSGGIRLRLGENPLQILALLVERPGEVVTREQIQQRLWPNGTVVEYEHSINAAVNKLREVLADTAQEPRYVETLPRRGYRLIVPLQACEKSEPVKPDRNLAASRAAREGIPETFDVEDLSGRTISHFRVMQRLPGGGMGIVYKAEDVRLGRPVALKFLPEELAENPRARERFERGSRAASTLNHPNICTIYEVEEYDGKLFLVMELLEGRTLHDRIAALTTVPSTTGGRARERRGEDGRPASLPLDELLTLAIQIADGLEAAHQKGLSHRDIKPANIFITTGGQAKILDFGLAKLTRGGASVARPAAEAEIRSALPEAGSVSSSGVVLGTAAYMSPEQARGERVDSRTDLFSLGAVLYEMATGRQAFAGSVSPLVFDAILHKAPTSPVRLNPDCPAELERIINKALEKDREMRYQSASEMCTDLKRLKRDAETASAVAAEPPSRRLETRAGETPALQRRWAAMALAGVALMAVIAAAAWLHIFRPARKAAGPPMRIVALTSFPGQQGRARFSPDGNQIAFVWNGEKEDNFDIYVKLIGTEKPLRLTTDPGVDMAPAWSPDGRYIAFCRRTEREDAIYVVPALGGPERKLYAASAEAMAQYMSSDWSPDGKYLAYAECRSDRKALNIFLLAVDNPQDKRPLTTSPLVEADYNPRFSPDGQTVAFVRCSGAGGAACDIFLVRTSGGKPKRLTFDSNLIYGLDWTPDGAYIVFGSDRLGGARLWKVRASGGEPEPLSVGQEGA